MSEQAVSPNYIRAFVAQTVKSVDKSARAVTHLITTASLDRAGDVVEPGGADLANFMRNPVVIANHDYTIQNVVGRALSMEITEDGILAKTQFRDTDLAKDAFALAQEGLGGWSIGFRPIEYDSVKDEKGRLKGFRFKRWEMLEYSIVAIPMNPDIVNNAVSRGLLHAENVAAFVKSVPSDPKPADAAPDGANADGSLEVHPALDPTVLKRLHRATLKSGRDIDLDRRLEALERARRSIQ